MKRRRVDRSADGLALMMSSVTSSYSADGLRELSQESADSTGRICVDNQSQDPVASYSGSRRKQQQHPVVSFYESAVATHSVVGKSSRELQYPVAGNTVARKEEVAKRCIQSKNESAAKQLTTYEELSKLDVNCRA
ncbi:hypothetical protein F511_15413 [Dorcoceras hygrometricum]|uniref:Uncharacterized protein n=1 Tax=Dorcoceras hygrometricum TaxID=472368 RepID=A0A2Z7BQV8_9LAMI|nr:hypothetical protein F511_15413 [Dorcoceras hygrometricum]